MIKLIIVLALAYTLDYTEALEIPDINADFYSEYRE